MNDIELLFFYKIISFFPKPYIPTPTLVAVSQKILQIYFFSAKTLHPYMVNHGWWKRYFKKEGSRPSIKTKWTLAQIVFLPMSVDFIKRKLYIPTQLFIKSHLNHGTFTRSPFKKSPTIWHFEFASW